MQKPKPWLDSWLNSDLFRPPILVFLPKIVFLGPPQNLLKTGFQGYLSMAIFNVQTAQLQGKECEETIVSETTPLMLKKKSGNSVYIYEYRKPSLCQRICGKFPK